MPNAYTPGALAPASAARHLIDRIPYVLGFLAVAVLLVLLAGVSIWQERVRQHERALSGTQNLARLLEARVADTLSQADMMLQAAALPAQEAADGAPAALQALAAAAPGLQGLRMADAAGRWRQVGDAPPAGSLPDGMAAEREEFQRARADPAAALLITGPLRHGAGSPWVLVLSRPVRDGDGRFAGLVSVDLPVNRFDALFAAIDLGDDGAVTLRTEALALVYRRPWPREGQAAVGSTLVSAQLRDAIAANPMAGEFDAATALDGIRRVNAYRRVADHPLYLLMGLPEDDFPRGWNPVDAAILALALATLGAAALATALLQRANRRQLDSAQRRLAAIVASSQDAIVSETLDGVITSWNPGAEALYGHPAAEMLGQALLRLVPDERREELNALLAQVRRGERVAHFETERLCRDGRRVAVSISISPVFDADGRMVGVAHSARDITQQKAMEAEVRQLAFHDVLTRLPNRRLLLDRLHRAQQTSRRLGSHAALLFLDLDGFKQLNDRLGHEAGDQMLVAVAQRLLAVVRETDTVARLGGDEFVVVCENLGAEAELAAARVTTLQAKILETVSQPVALSAAGSPSTVVCEASIGHRLFIGTGDEIDRLIADADAAMYRHKQLRRPPPAAPTGPEAGEDEDEGDDDRA